MHSLNLKEQLNEALKNYETLISLNNNTSNISRIYISNINDEDKLWIQQELEKVFGMDRFIIVYGDICEKELIIEVEEYLMKNIKYKLKTDIAISKLKKEPLGLWDLWINSMPTLTFQSPEDAAYAVVNKKTGYSVWIIRKK